MWIFIFIEEEIHKNKIEFATFIIGQPLYPPSDPPDNPECQVSQVEPGQINTFKNPSLSQSVLGLTDLLILPVQYFFCCSQRCIHSDLLLI